jgi:transcriptional regulator with XRE-family HTH domain
MTQDNLTQLSTWMRERELSLADLARQMDLDYSYLWRIAQGERPITNSFIGKFSQVFGFDEAGRVFGNGQQPEPQEMTA